jgi:hypothetical protein
MTVNQQYLNNYFGNIWHKHSDPCTKENKSGLELLTKITDNDSVIDVGCGRNPFKGKIKNLLGVDPAFDQADVKCTIDEFVTDTKFDVALCLGSINFGNENTILNQIKCVVNLLKPTARIYWRVNPGLQDHGNKECYAIEFFPWSPGLLTDFAREFGFEVAELKNDLNNRLYCEWSRSNT